ncbi:MAG: hypothetical protein LHW60_00335 [Candidatus Cloacimonetes bacterium]|nr:hypothetical protein [Candidatus Cloacimonadota bacterium]
MKKIVLIFIAFAAIVMPLCAQQGEYARKSVSSLGYVWLGPDVQDGAFDMDVFSLFLSSYIEVDRFDYNDLSLSSLGEFKRRASSLRIASVNSLGEIMQETVGREIVKILSDPDIQESRRLNIEDESARIRLAQTKGREFGLTAEQLEILMNSAYIYLPYVTYADWERDKDDVKYEIKGGIIWYQLQVDKDGKTQIVAVESSQTNGQGSATIGNKNHKSYTFQNKTFDTTPREYSMCAGMHAWTKNLSVNMRQIPDFSLTAQILERRSKKRFTTSLGRKDGVFLDDTFRVLEYYEDREGNVKSKRVGFGRIVKNVDNRNGKNPNKHSEIKLHWAKKVMPGAVLQEYPLLGLDLKITPFFTGDIYIPRQIFAPLNADDVDASLGINISMAYNLAPIIGITQTYAEMEFAVGMIDPEIDISNSNNFLYSVYGGLSRKFWIGRTALSLGGKAGIDLMSSNNEDPFYGTTTIGAGELAAKAEADLLYMLAPNFQLSVGASKGFPTGVIFSNKAINGNEIPINDYFLEEMDLSGMRFKVGFNWLLKQWSFNAFAWLDPLKRH